MSATNRGAKRHANDLYQTPMWLVKEWARLCRRVGHERTMVIDLGCGDGRIGDAVARACLTLVEPFGIDHAPSVSRWAWKGDFLQGSDPHDLARLSETFSDAAAPTLVVSNPPFSVAEEFVRKTLAGLVNCPCGSAAVFLLRLNFLGSLRRAEWLNMRPPQSVTVIAPRPSFTGGGTDACEYALFWWFRECRPAALQPIEWIVKS